MLHCTLLIRPLWKYVNKPPQSAGYAALGLEGPNWEHDKDASVFLFFFKDLNKENGIIQNPTVLFCF